MSKATIDRKKGIAAAAVFSILLLSMFAISPRGFDLNNNFAAMAQEQQASSSSPSSSSFSSSSNQTNSSSSSTNPRRTS
jgi:hypothetical protein